MKDYFEEIVGYEDIKNELRIISDMLNNPETYRKLGAELKEGVILSGKPGTGKTTMANCLIRSIGRETYVCRKNSSDGDFIKTINNAFQSAKMNTPSIVLLDDLDKFSEKEEECDAEELAAVQSCIDEVKGSDVFIIATVNSIRKIPDSLLRPGRLGKRIHVRLPRCKEATEIVRHYMSKLETCDDLDEESVARMLDGESCATLESVINNAAMKAAYNRQSCINMQNVIDACLDIIFEVPKGGEELSEEAKLRVAYHEAGHALASEVLNPGSVSIISIRKADGKYGFVRYLRKEEYEDIYSDYNESIIKTSLAGKAATELVFGEADMGANADLHNAFNKAVELVDNMCMYGFDNWIQDKYSSSFSAENRNRAMAMVLEKNYLEVKKLLVENRELLDKIADALIRNTTLTFSDVQYICKTKCTSLNLKRAGKQR
ncbi:MAG: AAA family ATPase [Lachnospiraceae bacterium]|nr:AAA family ATPase [Lachnospiraceae bacterium]